MSGTFDVVVAIPARDEEELLPLNLLALARQTGVEDGALAVVASCNNCRDATAARAREMADAMPFTLIVEEVTLPPALAHAGGARRAAMDTAARHCHAGGVILTTDADGVADADWVSAMVAGFARGADAVAGAVSTDWEQLSQFPADVLDIGDREWRYQLLCAELEALCDPEVNDPWPRHNQTCGANAGIRASWYARIGGLPAIPTGEDSAMFAAVWRRDGIIRHDPAPHVTVSARVVGRAQGGMADALALRHGAEYLCDDLLEPADDLAQRARWRHSARRAFAAGRLADWATAAGLDPQWAGDSAWFGESWQAFEARAPQLRKRRLTPGELDEELIRIAALIEEARL